MFRAIRNLTMTLAAVTTLATFNVVITEPASALPGFTPSAGYRPSVRPWIKNWGRPGNSTYNKPWASRPQYQPYWPRYGFNRQPNRWSHHPRFVRWHRPHVHVAPVVTTYATRTYVATPTYTPAPTYAAAPAPAAPVANRGTCLTKEYTQDGLVVFRDVCTQETATAPSGPAPQAGLAPASGAQHAPTQQGPALQPQVR
jgi:hypothetical protein